MHRLKEHLGKYWNIEIPLTIWILHLAIILMILPGEALKDERIFYNVALSFKNILNTFTINFLKTYNSPQTPLSFFLAGIILNIHESINLLRIVNSVIIMFTLYIFFSTIKTVIPKNTRISLLLATVFLLNPYIHFVSILFYTDALYLLCVVIILFSFIKNSKGAMFYFSMFITPLVRQFGIIFASGSALNEIKFRAPFVNKHFVFSILSLSGLVFFILLWNGTMPQSSFLESMLKVRSVYGSVYPYIPAYHLSALGFYLCPIFLYYIKNIYKQWSFISGGIIGAIFYILFPARQNYSTAILQPYNLTLGFYHKLMIMLFKEPYYHIALVIFAFIAGGWILYLTRTEGIPRLFKIWIIFFFLMSFFNLQAWDKYLLDIEAVILISFACMHVSSKKVSSHFNGNNYYI